MARNISIDWPMYFFAHVGPSNKYKQTNKQVADQQQQQCAQLTDREGEAIEAKNSNGIIEIV